MKIIKAGNIANKFPMIVACARVVDEYGFAYGEELDFCGTELEIEASDVRKHPWFKYPNYEGVDYGVICPVCGQFIAIDPQLISTHVKKTAVEVRLGR